MGGLPRATYSIYEYLRLDDLTAAQAGGTHPHTLVALRRFGVDGAQIDVPAPLRDVVGVADVVSSARTLAADFANLCHCLLQKTPDVRGETLIIPGRRRLRQPCVVEQWPMRRHDLSAKLL